MSLKPILPLPFTTSAEPRKARGVLFIGSFLVDPSRWQHRGSKNTVRMKRMTLAASVGFPPLTHAQEASSLMNPPTWAVGKLPLSRL